MRIKMPRLTKLTSGISAPFLSENVEMRDKTKTTTRSFCVPCFRQLLTIYSITNKLFGRMPKLQYTTEEITVTLSKVEKENIGSSSKRQTECPKWVRCNNWKYDFLCTSTWHEASYWYWILLEMCYSIFTLITI